jgi:hypothetical protein
MALEIQQKETKESVKPIIHIRVRKNITYYIQDKIRIAVTTARVIKEDKDPEENLA